MQEFVDFAGSLADLARPIASRYYGQHVPVDIKADDSPVTKADQEIEAAIREKILRTYPNHGVIGEEMGTHQGDAEYVWVIDPIDGTKAFIGHKPTFTTLISLCQNETPVLGIIDQPIKQERWSNASFNGEHTMVSETTDLKDCFVATTSIPYFNAEQMIFFQQLEHKTRSTILNHDAYAYGMLANGDIEIVLDVKMKPHDFCALIPVVEHAGGVITDWQGEPLSMKSAGNVIATANKTLHKQMLDLITSAA